MSFYCTLTSSGSRDNYSNNYGGSFRSDLPKSLFLDNRWQVGLVELIYKRDWAIIREGENKVVLEYRTIENETIRYDFLVPPGHYIKNNQLIDYFAKNDIPGEFKVELFNDTIKLSYTPNRDTCKDWRIGISISLAEILGFTQDQESFRDASIAYFKDRHAVYKKHSGKCKVEEYSLIAKRPMELTRDIETLFIHCNIVEPQIIGDKLLPVLRIVPVKGSYGETVSVEYNTPHYVHLSVSQIQSIFTEIFPTYSNRPIPFESGVILKLHFKREEEEKKSI